MHLLIASLLSLTPVSALCMNLGKASNAPLLDLSSHVSSLHREPYRALNPGQNQPSGINRQENPIFFGNEEQSMIDTMESVKKMLQFVVGHPTPVKDLFRIGR